MQNVKKHIKNTRILDNKFINIFTTHFKYSKNLIKYKDDILFDTYDHNYFSNSKQVTFNELVKAHDYQIDNEKDYLKIITYNRLKKKYIQNLKLKESIVATMIFNGEIDDFKINKNVKIKPITLKDLNEIEIKHYGKEYGLEFYKRRNKRYYYMSNVNNDFVYYGAYINNKIVGSFHVYKYNGYACIDSLLVDRFYRHKHIASTIFKYVLLRNKYLCLHAYSHEKAFNYYKKLGFVSIDKQYDYYKCLTVPLRLRKS